MDQGIPVDVISVCSADGQIRPLRLRLEDESKQMLRIHIEEIISTRDVPYVGAEAMIFQCRAVLWGQSTVFELKYSLRSHSWRILRKLH